MLETVFCSAVFLLIAIFLFSRLRYTAYRLRQENIERLFESMLNHEATVSDWHVFLAVPLYYDDFLEEIRCQCVELEERESCVTGRRILSRQGEAELAQLLQKLQQHGQVLM